MNKDEFDNTFLQDLLGNNDVTRLQEHACHVLNAAGYHPIPIDSETFESWRTREVVYATQTAANAIGILEAANIYTYHTFVSYGHPNRFLPQGITNKQRAIYIALLLILFPFATMVFVGWLIYNALALYSQSKAAIIVQLGDTSYLQVARMDE